MTERQPHDVQSAIGKLASFHDGDLGVLDAIACGEEAIPSLRALLFRREPSGLFQARCRAVEVLGALGAFNVLMEFLIMERVTAGSRVFEIGSHHTSRDAHSNSETSTSLT